MNCSSRTSEEPAIPTQQNVPVRVTHESEPIAGLNQTVSLRSISRVARVCVCVCVCVCVHRRLEIYSRLMWRSGPREQRQHKEREKDEHSQSDPETDDDRV